MSSHEPDVRLGISYRECNPIEGRFTQPGDVYELILDPIEGKCANVRTDIVAFVLSSRPGVRCFEVRTERSFLRSLLALDDFNPFADSSDPLVATVLITAPGELALQTPGIVIATNCQVFPGQDVAYQVRCARWVDSVAPEGSDWRQMLQASGRLEASAASDSPLAEVGRVLAGGLGAGAAALLPLLVGAAVLAVIIKTRN